MKRLFKKVSLVLVFVILVSISTFGCVVKDKDNNTKEEANKTTTQAVTIKSEDRIKLRMFMSNANLPHPSGVDPSDNEFINMVEDYANVDLELEIPAYADFTTKQSLMLASSNIPDVVHTSNLKPVLEAAEAGMFIELKKYYDNSVNVKTRITPIMMELSKAPSGKYLRIPMAGMPPDVPQGGGIKVRYDLLKKFNDGKYPATMDEWFDVFAKVVADDPEMMILMPSKNSMANGGAFPFYMNGVNYPDDVIFYSDGKAVYAFETPEFRVGLQKYKEMYDLGYVDQEFLTRPNDSRNALLNKGKIMFGWGASNEIIGQNMNFSLEPSTKDFFYTMTPPIQPEVGDIMNALPKEQGLIHPQHSLLISASCKFPDRAFEVIEGLADPEFIDYISWGTEGEEYIVKDEKRVPIPEKLNAPERAWARHLSLIGSMQVNYAPRVASLEINMTKENFKAVIDSQMNQWELAKKKGNAFSDGDLGYVPDAVKQKDASDYISETIVKVIMGQESISWYDSRVAEFKKLYGKLAQDRADYLYANRAEIEKKGFKFWWEK